MLCLVPFFLFSTTADAKAMDFWIGEWTCTGRSINADGKTWSETKATNRIVRILDNKVIHENFAMGSFRGQSWSVYNPTAKRWQQTWVDNQGSYIDLSGGLEDGVMTLTTLPKPKAPLLANRMRFTEIKRTSFKWLWEKTTDGGKSWQLQWELNYARKR